VEFDKSGEHLATGDQGGRVVLFERLRHSKTSLETMRGDERNRDAEKNDLNGQKKKPDPVEYRYVPRVFQIRGHRPFYL